MKGNNGASPTGTRQAPGTRPPSGPLRLTARLTEGGALTVTAHLPAAVHRINIKCEVV